MIRDEHEKRPVRKVFDFGIASVGFERRCRWVFETGGVSTDRGIGLEFGFLMEGSYTDNRQFFGAKGFTIINGVDEGAIATLCRILNHGSKSPISVLVDISSMSRLMIANVVQALKLASLKAELEVCVAYAPSRFSEQGGPAPIRQANPIQPFLAGWSTKPEQPLAAIMGLGAEQDLALGALQWLEPDKTWTFSPRGIDRRFDRTMTAANRNLGDIFEVVGFEYEIRKPALARAKLEALLNAVEGYYRIVAVPFGPKIFAWILVATIVFNERSEIGIWAFSSKEEARVVDREAQGPIVWYSFILAQSPQVARLADLRLNLTA